MGNLERDLQNPTFFWRPGLFFDFYFFFFFRSLWAAIISYSYIRLNAKKVLVNTWFTSRRKKTAAREILFVGDSTLSFPMQEYAYPYLLLRSGYARRMRIFARPGFGAKKLIAHLPAALEVGQRYDTIFISCFQVDIISPSVQPEAFEKSSRELLAFLLKKLKPGGKIVYIFGDFSNHKIVPNNYFKRYFRYKTERFLAIIKKQVNEKVVMVELMGLDRGPLSWGYFYHDLLHFSQKGQQRLFDDLMFGLVKSGLV